MFTSYPTYSRYRGLRLTKPMMVGEDVFALQTALNAASFPCGNADGILGKMTSDAIRYAQTIFDLVSDGIAGGITQRELAFWLAISRGQKHGVPAEALCGQLETESGPRLGNYSPQRPDGTYDAGVAQRNTKYTPANVGFIVPVSIDVLASNTRKYFNLFEGVSPLNRRWGLAQGAWNAPAFACYLAKEEGAVKVTTSMTLRPTLEQRLTFEGYIDHVTMYLR